LSIPLFRRESVLPRIRSILLAIGQFTRTKIGCGISGRSSLSKLIGGSVSEKVIRQSPVPVTIIHSNGAVLERSRNDVRQADGAESSQVSVGLG